MMSTPMFCSVERVRPSSTLAARLRSRHPRHNAFLYSCASCVKRVFYRAFFSFIRLGSSTHLNDRYTAYELRGRSCSFSRSQSLVTFRSGCESDDSTIDAPLLPAPSTMVLLSLSMTNFFARQLIECGVLELESEIFRRPHRR